MAAPKKQRGRPKLPRDKRTARRVTVRLYEVDDALLRQLCSELGASETEVVRQALQSLAETSARKSR